MIAKCACQHCGNPIEFEAEDSGAMAECPHCGSQTQLSASTTKHEFKIPIIGNILQKHRDKKQHALNVETFKDMLISAARNGSFTSAQCEAFNEQISKLGITAEDIPQVLTEVFTTGLSGALEDCAISPQSEDGFKTIMAYFGINEYQLPNAISGQLIRARYLYSLRQGHVQSIEVPGLNLLKSERAFWSEPATLYEDHVTRRHYEGGSAGVSFRVMRGVSFRVGQQRGQLICDHEMLPVSSGNLVITNQRLIFMGNDKAFVSKYEKIIELQYFTDGLKYSESNRQKPRLLKFQAMDGEFFAQVLQYALEKV